MFNRRISKFSSFVIVIVEQSRYFREGEAARFGNADEDEDASGQAYRAVKPEQDGQAQRIDQGGIHLQLTENEHVPEGRREEIIESVHSDLDYCNFSVRNFCNDRCEICFLNTTINFGRVYSIYFERTRLSFSRWRLKTRGTKHRL